jgi:hypothetical protein
MGGATSHNSTLHITAAGTEEWVGVVHPPDQISPTLSEGGTMLGSQLRPIGCCIAVIYRCPFQLETVFFSQSARSRGIGPKVMNIMFSGFGDLGEDASDELEGIEVAGDDGIDEASPESVFFLEVLLPDGLDVLVVGLE